MAGAGSARPELRELRLTGDPRAWARLGFTVAGAACRVGEVVLRFEDPVPGREGIVSWALGGLRAPGDIDGLRTESVAPGTPPEDPVVGEGHANGAMLVDHVVVTTPDLERTFAALADAGLDLRRVREAGAAPAAMQQAGLEPARLRQGFYRLGAPVLEVVGPDRPGPDAAGPAAFWGLVVVVADLEVCGRLAGEHLGEPRDAVQPGRRIATVRRSAGLGVPMAFMTPDRRRR